MAADNSVSQKWKDLADFLRDRLAAKPTRLVEWTEDKSCGYRIEGEEGTRYTKVFRIDPETRNYFNGEDFQLTLHWNENFHTGNGWWLEPLKIRIPYTDPDTPGFPQPALVFDILRIGMFTAKCTGVRSYFNKDHPSILETEYEFTADRSRPFIGHWSLADTFGGVGVSSSVKWLDRPGGHLAVAELVSRVQRTVSSWHMPSEKVVQCEQWLRTLDRKRTNDTVTIHVDSPRLGGPRLLTLSLEELQPLGLACGLGTQHGFFLDSAREIKTFCQYNEADVLQLLLLCKFRESFDLGYKIGKDGGKADLVQVYKLAHQQQIGDDLDVLILLLRKCEIYLLQCALNIAIRSVWQEFIQLRDELKLYDLPVLKMGMRLIAQEHTWRGVDRAIVEQVLMEL